MRNCGFSRFLVRSLVLLSVSFTTTAGYTFGQSSEARPKNNPYSPSPSGRSKPPEKTPDSKKEVAFVMNRSEAAVWNDSPPLVNIKPSVAQASNNTASEIRNVPPTDIYKIGTGDVLYVQVKNLQHASGYFTVRADGTIDFPLAGENLIVAGHTPESAQDLLASGIKILKDPYVEIKVRQYGSHRVTVSGMVENGGDKFLQREAMPLFAIRAEAVVSPKATRVTIKKGLDHQGESYDLRDPRTEDILIFPGYSVEFLGENAATVPGSTYIIAGEVASNGQKELTHGLTLYQAAVIAGIKGEPKKAVIRRKNEKGLFTNMEVNFRAIRDGKQMDPRLAAGDVVEIRN